MITFPVPVRPTIGPSVRGLPGIIITVLMLRETRLDITRIRPVELFELGVTRPILIPLAPLPLNCLILACTLLNYGTFLRPVISITPMALLSDPSLFINLFDL